MRISPISTACHQCSILLFIDSMDINRFPIYLLMLPLFCSFLLLPHWHKCLYLWLFTQSSHRIWARIVNAILSKEYLGPMVILPQFLSPAFLDDGSFKHSALPFLFFACCRWWTIRFFIVLICLLIVIVVVIKYLRLMCSSVSHSRLRFLIFSS